MDIRALNSAAVFHKLYMAVFYANKEAPEIFSDQECTRILTAVMSAKWFSWRVVGITEAALKTYAASDFRHQARNGLSRAHKVPRIKTVRELLSKDAPFDPMDFMRIWITNDVTVICAKGENKAELPPYIPISNDEGLLFGCDRKLAGWYYRKKERNLLMSLHQDYQAEKVQLVSI